ncbi:MAG TPA: DUF5658 family protein [Gemmataceae bacterium]|nr:DUF5658 family protein [Gemmataceae bacterium]
MTPRRLPRLLITLFVLLSAADLALTCYLLGQSNGQFYEANWLAGSVLTRFGFAGLAVFKVLMVVFVSTLVGIIAARRPSAARRVASFACLAVGIVVVYSVTLCSRMEPQSFALARQAPMTFVQR